MLALMKICAITVSKVGQEK